MSRPADPPPQTGAGSDERFRAVVEASPFGMHFYRLEPDGRLVFTGANPAADRILRVSNAQFVGKAIEEAFPALLATDVPRRYREVARDGIPWHAEQVTYEHDRIAGAFEVHAFRTAPGEMAAAFQDITERKRAEWELAREKERLAVTLRSIGDAVIVTDTAGRVTLMNPVAEQLTGWTAAEAEGAPLVRAFRIVSEATGAPVEDPAARVLREGQVVGLANHTLLVARDGTRRPIADSGAPIVGPGADGAVSGVVLVFRDQTAERERERRLMESEARYRAVVQSVPLVQWITDRDGRFTLSEGLALASLGLRPGQVVGRTVAEVYGDNPQVLADFRRALAGETFVSEDRIGKTVIESRWGPVRDADGQVVGVAGLGLDVTAERRLQEQVQRAQKLESVGRLAGGVAHDFNNLLTVILSCVEELQHGEAAGAAREDVVDQIRLASERARDVTRQLLAFARREVVAPRPLDLNAVVSGSEPLLRRVLGEDVELDLSPAPGLWPILCDPAQLEQVLLNLAVNARDAMADGGRIALSTANVTLTTAAAARPGDLPGDWVRLRFQDEGMGMTPEVKEHLFEPFFTTKGPGRGTGLGLATVYGIVTQAGGHLHVESEPGRGTTFELCFPRTTGTVVVAAAAAPRAPVAGRERILVVEDDALVRSVTVRALEGAGYRVLLARDGREALERAGDERAAIDLVITDVVLPGQGGRAVVEELRARRPGLRALYVSGYAQDAIAQRGVLEPGLHFLPKPFTPASLLEHVRRVLDGGEAGSGR